MRDTNVKPYKSVQVNYGALSRSHAPNEFRTTVKRRLGPQRSGVRVLSPEAMSTSLFCALMDFHSLP